MHPTQSVALVHDRHRSLRATAPAAAASRAERAGSHRASLVAPVRAAWAAASRLVPSGRRPVGRLATPSDC